MKVGLWIAALAVAMIAGGSWVVSNLTSRFAGFDVELHSRFSALDGVPLDAVQKKQKAAFTRAVKAFKSDAPDLKKTMFLAGKVAGILDTAFPADAPLYDLTTAMDGQSIWAAGAHFH